MAQILLLHTLLQLLWAFCDLKLNWNPLLSGRIWALITLQAVNILLEIPPSLPFLSLTLPVSRLLPLSFSSAFPHLMLRDCESVFARWHLVLHDTFLSVYIFFPTSLSWFTCKFSIVLP